VCVVTRQRGHKDCARSHTHTCIHTCAWSQGQRGHKDCARSHTHTHMRVVTRTAWSQRLCMVTKTAQSQRQCVVTKAVLKWGWQDEQGKSPALASKGSACARCSLCTLTISAGLNSVLLPLYPTVAAAAPSHYHAQPLRPCQLLPLAQSSAMPCGTTCLDRSWRT